MPFQLRDQHGASRSIAYLMLTAAPYVLFTAVLEPGLAVPKLLGVAGVALVLAAGGFACLRVPERLPSGFWVLAPFVAIIMIVSLNLITSDTSTGPQMFYLWPVLYAANFLSRTVVHLVLAAVSAGQAAVVFPLVPSVSDALSDWVALTVAMTLTGLIVISLRERNERLRDTLERQALADSLTGVANRRSFDEALSRSVAWAHRTGSPLALITIDVDTFKKINDTYGHAVGDQALRMVAAALQEVARRADDVVARLGGDEFAMLLRTDTAGARAAADEIRAAVGAAPPPACGTPGLSIGIALLPDHAATAEQLVGASDAALYEAKAGGRGRTAVAHPPTSRYTAA